MSVRLETTAPASRTRFPDSGVVHVDGVGEVPVGSSSLKKGEGRSS